MRGLWILALLLHLAAATLTVGHYHIDEHNHILELAALKLDKTAPEDLTWEFPRRMRPALQPAIAYAVVKVTTAFGLENPFVHATLLRVLSALLSFCCIAALAWAFLRGVEDRRLRDLFLVLSCFLWFMPFLHVRFSGENWSGSLFWIAVALLVVPLERPGRSKIQAAAGVLLGLAFLCRFQSGFLMLGLGLWLVIVQREKPRHLLVLAIAFFGTLGVGVVLDHWLYGEWVLSAWNYFVADVMDNQLARFGRHYPWWSYPVLIAVQGIPPLSLLLFPVMVIFCACHPKHPLTWSSLALFLIHSAFARKSLRYLFPLAPVIPMMIVLTVASLRAPENRFARALSRVRWRPGRGLVVAALAVNLGQLLFFSLTPATRAIRLQQVIYQQATGGDRVVASLGEGPYSLRGQPTSFYRPANLSVQVVTDRAALSTVLAESSSVLLFSQGFELDPDLTSRSHRADLVYRSLPGWVRHFNVIGWVDRNPPLQLHLLSRESCVTRQSELLRRDERWGSYCR